MNILFITLSDIRTIKDSGIYTDLMREFIKHENNVFIVSPSERRTGLDTKLYVDDYSKFCHILKIKTGNIQKTNIIEKGISTVLIEGQIKAGIKKYFKDIRFDLILYTTPPITIVSPIKYVKKRDNARTYLMLKDIFPQNAIDIGLMTKSGLKGILYRYFRNKEKKLYQLSDKIGCMSNANISFVSKNNPEIPKEKLELCPNALEYMDLSISNADRLKLREEYGLPKDKKILVYGGNLGKPQDINFVIECIKAEKDNEDFFFFIVGSGTEYSKLDSFIKEEKPNNVKLMSSLKRDVYDRLIASCDIGLIFLDHRFTIPNYPSRLLSYVQIGIPVLAAVDKNTDVGLDIENYGLGFYCESNDPNNFVDTLNKFYDFKVDTVGLNKYMNEFASIKKIYEKIMVE